MEQGIHFIDGIWVIHEHFGDGEGPINKQQVKSLDAWEHVKTDEGEFMRGFNWRSCLIFGVKDHEQVNSREGVNQAATYELKKLD